jgi:gliding motility-associated-like protein
VDLMAQTVIYPCFGLYHMSLSIADVTDNILQSAVFLKKGSFSSPQITSERTSALGSSNDTIMDFCNPAYIKLKLSEPNLTAVNFVTLDLGAAANADAIWGTDYRVYNTTTGAEMQSGEEISFNTGVADYGPDGIPIITGSDTVRELRIEAIPGALQPGEVKTAKIRTAITTTGTASVCLNVVKRDTVTIILKGYVKLELGEDTVINICNQFNDALDIPLKKGWLKSVTWQGDHIGYLNFNSADSLTATLTSPITDTANFTIIAEDRYGCSRDTAHIRINIPPRPTVEIQTNVPAGCTPFKFSPSAIFTPSYATLHWQTDEGETSAIKNPTFTITQDGKVWLYAYTDYYCYDSTFVPIDVFERPSADFTYLPLEPLNGRPIEFYNASTGDISDFRWNFGDGTTSTEINPIHTYHVNNSELFNVRLITIAGAVENCADTTMQQLLVEDHYAYYVPTGFSPNGDGINDEFTPTLMDAFDYTFAVYNRWGSLVFFSNEIGSGWDGNDKNGNECENGVYVWKISFKKYTDPNALLEHKGMVTLVR